MITHTDRNIGISHRAAMFGRRVRQLGRVPGFTPVLNARINSKIATVEGLLLMAAADAGKSVNPNEVRWEAERQVASKLPPLPMGRKKFMFRPDASKYNQENTRGNR